MRTVLVREQRLHGTSPKRGGLLSNCRFALFSIVSFEHTGILFTFAAITQSPDVMNTLQLNAEMLRSMSVIAEDETLLKRAVKYLHKLIAEKQANSAEMTRDEFLARVDEGREQIRRGEGLKMLPNESLEDFLNRVG